MGIRFNGRLGFYQPKTDAEKTASSERFSAPENPGYYSMQMALDSGLIDGTGATRAQALAVPAVLRGRNMICNIATLPLVEVDQQRNVITDPLLSQIDPDVPNVVTLASTVEDLLMDGIGWWKILERDTFGFPVKAQHVDSQRVTINPPSGYVNRLPSGVDPASVVYIDGKPISGRDMIRFDSPNPPLLVAAARAINRAIRLENAALMYAEDPRPMDYFSPGENTQGLEKEKIEGVLRSWIASRKKRATAYVPETLKYNTVQAPNPVELQLSQQQEAAGRDIANAIGIDPEDLGISTTSRTYQNDTSRNQARVNDVLSVYMRAITDRLSMGDITRSGFTVKFNVDDYLRADPKTRWENHKIALEIGAMDADEIREIENLPERVIVPNDPAALEEAPVENAREGSMETFDSAPNSVTLRIDGDGSTFSVDQESRTITGTALLYGVGANNGSGTFTFQEGSVSWKKSAVTRVKFLRDHDWSQLLGTAVSIKEENGALTAKFKVARGTPGDEALALAEDGVLDGLSVGLDIQHATKTRDGYLVTAATLNEVSLTPRPAFDDARITSVAASLTDEGKSMTDETPVETPALDDKIAAAVAAALENFSNKNAADKVDNEAPAVVDATKRPAPAATFEVKEQSPYSFDRSGRFVAGEHEFSTDFGAMLRDNDLDGTRTPAGKRVMGHVSQNFVVGTDVNELNPAIQQPSKYYEAPGTRTPIFDLINKGGLPNGVQPFTLPKFSSASGLVADHVEGTEPDSGTFVTTSQTITPSALSGKVSVSREVIDMGGNPAVSNLIWNRMVRSYQEGLETASATFLGTLSAATNVDLSGGASTNPDALLAKELKALVVSLNFLPGYDWDAFVLEEQLYTKASNALAADGRPVFPVLNPSNADGQAASLWQRLNIGGLVGTPAAALPHTAGTLNSSWLFDRSVVHGYASAPQRFSFAGTDASGDYAPVAMVDIAIWGYKAFANIDIAGVRQVTYDTDLDSDA